MKRGLIAIAVALVVALVVVGVAKLLSGEDKDSYKVRAVFHSAFTVIKGEDVKVAGVKVGKIDSLEVTDDNKAAVILDITDPGFQQWRADASCSIRPQSLIGERFVECMPTQPRADGDPEPPLLKKIDDGDGKGQYLLPASQTSKPVDLDLLQNIMRLPYRQRFSIIINELGTGLAANGDELRQAIRAADPALMETDKVLKIFADQNKILAQLAEDGDKVLQPLARDREKVADFIVKANTTAQATAERRADLEANFEKFPAFLRELRPTMRQLGAMTDQITPVVESLGAAAPDINRLFTQMGPFAQAATPALTSLGDAADVGNDALLASKPILGDLRTFANQAKPTTKNLSAMLTSLRDTGGVERLMDLFFYTGTASNGFDSLGHYLRSSLIIGNCTDAAVTTKVGCGGNFQSASASSASAATASASVSAPRRAASKPKRASAKSEKLTLPTLLPGQKRTATGGPTTGQASSDTPTSTASPSAVREPTAAASDDSADAKLLDYLLGD